MRSWEIEDRSGELIREIRDQKSDVRKVVEDLPWRAVALAKEASSLNQRSEIRRIEDLEVPQFAEIAADLKR